MSSAEDPAAGLDDEQRAAVAAPRGPVCVLAGAGTGKTRTITHRIAHLVRTGHVAPGQVLAVTFTARAAGEMRTRLRALGVPGVQARTFHAAALRQLRYFWPQVVGGGSGRCWSGKLRLVGAGRRPGAAAGTDAATLRDLAGEIEWAKASLVDARRLPGRGRHACAGTPRRPPSRSPRSTPATSELKNRAELLDFDDLLLHTAAVLEEHRGVAEEFRDRYRCFVVDEYQDVTPAAAARARRLARRPRRAHRRRRRQPDDLLLRRRDPRHLLDFPRRVPRAPRGAAGARLPVHPAGGRPRPTGDRRRARPGRGHAAAARRPACRRARSRGSRVPRRARRGRRPSRARSGA